MPKQKRKLTQREQSERFRRAVQEKINAGELNPTEAEAALEQMMGKIKRPPDPGEP